MNCRGQKKSSMTKSNNPPPLPFKSLQTFLDGGGGAEFHHTFASSLLLLGAAVPSSYDDDVDIIHHADDLFVAVSFIISKSTKPDRPLFRVVHKRASRLILLTVSTHHHFNVVVPSS